MSTSYGQPTNAVYGFLNILNKIIKRDSPLFMAACFDVSRDTFRSKKFAEYKLQRPPMPDDLKSQIPIIKEIILAYGIKIIEKEGFEADDIIATLSRKAKKESIPVTIVSSDKDILQLVDDNTEVFSPYKDSGVSYNKETVVEKYGVKAEQITDIIALMGDSVDNIPGVPGVGEKTASELIKEFGSLKNLLLNIENIKKEKIKQSIASNIDTLKLNMELVLLDNDVDLEFDQKDLKIKEPDYKKLFEIFKRLEFRKMLENLPVPADEKPKQEVAQINKNRLEGSLKNIEELYLLGDNLERLVFSNGRECFCLENIDNAMKAALADPKIKKIGHDLKKIKVFLAREDIVLEGLYFDTMIAAYLVNPSRGGYELGDIVLDYLGEMFSLDSKDYALALEYIVKLKPVLEKLLKERELGDLFNNIEMPLSQVLAEMEIKGIKIDTQVLKELGSELEKRLIELIGRIYDLSGTQFNINSPKQLREILFEKLKLPVVKKSKTGPSTDEEVLRKLSEVHELPKDLLEYRQLTKLKTTYVDALPQLIDPKTGRIHTSFNQTVTETGRLSSSNPNLQNLPIKTDIGARIRQAVVAKDKHSYLLACDYSQIELRILAHISQDEALLAAFRDDQDVHKATAALIFGVEEKEVTDQMREVAKRVNFGIVYGLTSYGLSKDLKVPVDQAQAFIDAYFARYPKVKEYIDTEIKKAQDNGFVTTILGRRRYIPEINNKNLGIRQFAQRQAVNTPIQGSASDLIKLAMIDINKQLKEKKLKSSMLIQVHDELVFDVPAAELTVLTALVKESMENVLKLSVPIKVTIKFGKNWLET